MRPGEAMSTETIEAIAANRPDDPDVQALVGEVRRLRRKLAAARSKEVKADG